MSGNPEPNNENFEPDWDDDFDDDEEDDSNYDFDDGYGLYDWYK